MGAILKFIPPKYHRKTNLLIRLNKGTVVERSKEIIHIEIVSIEASIMLYTYKSSGLKPTRIVIPYFPQFEANSINCTQRLPIAEQFLGWKLSIPVRTRVELNYKLFDVVETLWLSKYSIKRWPLGAFDVNLQNVNRCLQNYNTTHHSQPLFHSELPTIPPHLCTFISQSTIRQVRGKT